MVESIMNRMLCHTFVAVLVLCFSTVCLAVNKPIIQGFEQAERFNGSSSDTFYIQAGSFLQKALAIKYQKYLQSKTSYPVVVSQKGKWATVIVGPIGSGADVRKTAEACRQPPRLYQQASVREHSSPEHFGHSATLPTNPKPRFTEQKKLLHTPKNITTEGMAGSYSKQRPSSVKTTPSSPMASQVKPPFFNIRAYKPIVTLTIGPDFISQGQAQTLTLLPPFEMRYTANAANEVVLDGGIFLGVERVVSERLAAQLGVVGYAGSNARSQGHVWQFAEPEFDNLTYLYYVQHSRLMLAGKLLSSFTNYQAIHPYFSWELGAALNRATGYREVSFTPGVAPMDPFANHSKYSFAYGVGFGVDYNLSQHIRLGTGYQFADLGAASLGMTSAESTAETLSLSHGYTNQLRFQLTFIA